MLYSFDFLIKNPSKKVLGIDGIIKNEGLTISKIEMIIDCSNDSTTIESLMPVIKTWHNYEILLYDVTFDD